MSQAVRPDGILPTTEMPDGPRRSARIAELAEKRRVSDVKTTESHPKLSRHTIKEQTGPVKPLGPSQNPAPKEPAAESSKTRRRKALKRPKDNLANVEREALSNRGLGPRRVAEGTSPQEPRASERLAAKHLVRQPLQHTLTGDAVRSPGFEADPWHETAGATLSREALRLLETQTAKHPLPEGLSAYQRSLNGRDMPTAPGPPTQAESTTRTTVYDKEFLDVLEEQGVLEQQFLDQSPVPKHPTNYDDIQSAIKQERPHSPEPTIADYNQYARAVFNSRSEDAVRRKLFSFFFGLPINMKDGHVDEDDRGWTKCVAIIGTSSPENCKQKPKPDYAEGLKIPDLPAWMRKRLGALAVPSGTMAFPNFAVELKRDKSMFTAHAQNRHCGSIAAQAYHEYYTLIRGTPKESWGIAKVASIEFNGDAVVGNIHWVENNDSEESGCEQRRYYMTRALCRFTCGLGYEDFKIARREARNFRDYFFTIRDDLRNECRSLRSPRAARTHRTTRSNPSPSLIQEQQQHQEGSSTERPESPYAEPEELNAEQEPSIRNTRKRSKGARGNARKDPPGRKPKKRRNGNTEQVTELNETGISQEAASLVM